MGVRHNKRGNFTDIVLSPMFALIIVVALVFLPLLNYATAVGKSSYYERQFYSKDLGLMVSALQASPNDVTLTYDNVKNVNVSFYPDYIETHAYNVNPVKSPSKVSKFHIFPSTLEVLKTMISPTLLIAPNGEKSVVPYSITLNKDKASIKATSSNGFSSLIGEKTDFENNVNDLISVLYDQKKIYIDVVHGAGTAKDGTSADLFGKNICYSAWSGTSFSTADRCNMNGATTLDERISLAKASDFVVVILVNEKSSDALKVYYYDGTGSIVDASKSVAENTVTIFKNGGYTISKDDIRNLYNDEVKKILTPEKPGFVIEIGNVENLDKPDIKKIGELLQKTLLVASK